MQRDLAVAEVVAPRRRPLGFELALVIVVAIVVLAPGIWSYSLIDPWETHYGEVAREMLETHDFVHTDWRGTATGAMGDNEGFRSKPVLSFWLMAGSMRAVGVAADGGYSGEMVASERTMIGIRLPFILCAVAGLVLMWWMLARLVSRRLAWLALLVVGSCPMFCLIARQAIPDMPLCACTMGAVALFAMAMEDGDRAPTPLNGPRARVRIDARHVVIALIAAFVLPQAIYDAVYFAVWPQLAIRGRVFNPAIWLPGMMLFGLGAMSRDGWQILRWPFVLVGAVIAAIINEPMPPRAPGQSMWRYVFDNIVTPCDRHALDRYAIAALPLTLLVGLGVAFVLLPVPPPAVMFALLVIASLAIVWWLIYSESGWAGLMGLANRFLYMAPLTSMRQVFLLGCYFLLGVSVLAKGPPGLAVVGFVGVFYVLLTWRWRELWNGGFELKRGLVLMATVALPWHLGMYLKEGLRFVSEYFFTHILDRATADPDKSIGTFEHYTSQLGPGMWLWAALVPAAVAIAFLRARTDTREGRVRFLVCLWAIGGVAVFALVQTKFHHYILPAVPPLALLVAWYLADIWDGRERLHPLYAGVAIGIVLLVCRDLMFEPDRWVEMFTYRYDRPWPTADPYQVDPSDGFLGLGLTAAVALALTAVPRLRKIGVLALGVAGLAICLWAEHGYMPVAGTHWGMRDAMRAYYEQRNIYGEKLVYFDPAQIKDDWGARGDRQTWTFDTFVPDTLQVGQPMTISIQLNKAEDERQMEAQAALIGTVTGTGAHSVTVTLGANESQKLRPLVSRPSRPHRTRPPVRAVDADRLLAWQLYWRGENFWSGDEIWDWLPEMHTSFVKTDNGELMKFFKDPSRIVPGRRYFVVAENGRITSIRPLLPTERAKASFEVLDTTSNKFAMASFVM